LLDVVFDGVFGGTGGESDDDRQFFFGKVVFVVEVKLLHYQVVRVVEIAVVALVEDEHVNFVDFQKTAAQKFVNHVVNRHEHRKTVENLTKIFVVAF
jgi:hypothetical protein